jgi:hypothetical protein
MWQSKRNGKGQGARKVSDLLPSLLQKNCFEQRSHLGLLIERWKEIFDDEFGSLVERNGDVLIIKVKGAPMRSELENFKKWDMLEILHMQEEFSGIRDLQFRE